MHSEMAGTAVLTEHVLEREGCPIHYWIGGPQDRPLVIFTHGACVDHHSFDPIAPVIARQYRVLTWDVPGHGLSQPMGRPFSIPLAVDDLMALMHALDHQQAVFVGHSNGSYISQEMAFRHPEQVTALVIADGTNITGRLSAFERWLVHASNDFMALLPYETLKKAGLPYVSTKKEVRDYTYAAYSMLSKPDYLTIWRGATECLHYEPNYHITQPLLLVHGAQDAMGNIRKIAPQWAAETPNCQYAVIPNASHFAILDDPQAFLRLLLDFLARWAP